MAGLLRRDFQDTVRQFPVLGSLPIIGTLFRSTGFQKEETELVIIVTPRLVQPVARGRSRRRPIAWQPPNEADLFLLGRTDNGVPAASASPQSAAARRPIRTAAAAPPPGGTAQRAPTGLEKEYGHVL